MAYLIDTGILLRLRVRNDPNHHSIRSALKRLRSRGEKLFTALQNVAEFWNVSTRPDTARGGYGLNLLETEYRLRAAERMLKVLTDTPETYVHWRRLVRNHAVMGVQVHDARLAAIMLSYGITHLLTLNGRDFVRYHEITAVTPAELLADAS